MTKDKRELALEALEALRPMIGEDTPNDYWYEIGMVISKHMDTIREALDKPADRQPPKIKGLDEYLVSLKDRLLPQDWSDIDYFRGQLEAIDGPIEDKDKIIWDETFEGEITDPYTRPKIDWWWLCQKLKQKKRELARLNEENSALRAKCNVSEPVDEGMPGELKSCPFCGSIDIDPEGCASFKEEYRSKDYTWDKDATPDKITHHPACNNCNATTDGDWNSRSPQIDWESTKRKIPAINECFDAENNQIPIELEAYTEGWNAAIDHLKTLYQAHGKR